MYQFDVMAVIYGLFSRGDSEDMHSDLLKILFGGLLGSLVEAD
jgi:hypothetical protein